jgi:hypothetical protein
MDVVAKARVALMTCEPLPVGEPREVLDPLTNPRSDVARRRKRGHLPLGVRGSHGGCGQEEPTHAQAISTIRERLLETRVTGDRRGDIAEPVARCRNSFTGRAPVTVR